MILKNDNGSTYIVFGQGTLRSGTYHNSDGEPEGIVISSMGIEMDKTIFIPLNEPEMFQGLVLSLTRFFRDNAKDERSKQNYQSAINKLKDELGFDVSERVAKFTKENKGFTFSNNVWNRIQEYIKENGYKEFVIENSYSLRNDIVHQCVLPSGKEFRLVVRYYETKDEYVEIHG